MSDIFSELDKSVTRKFSIVEEGKNTYLQIVYADNSVNRFPVGCWFLMECVLETFSQREKQYALQLIGNISPRLVAGRI